MNNSTFPPLLQIMLRFRLDDANTANTTSWETNLRLGKEYVRRAALWARMLTCEADWPFFDAVEYLSANFALDPAVDDSLRTHLYGIVGGRMANLLRAAMRLQAYQLATGFSLPGLPNLYAPVIAMYLHHGELAAEHHLILTPINGFLKRPFSDYLTIAPYVSNDELATLLVVQDDLAL